MPLRSYRLALALTAAALLCAAPSSAQTTDVNAEARVFFDRGTALLEQAAQARGRRRRRLLENSLQAFVSTLRIVRSRNALFNAALVLEQLARPSEAFAYYREYLDIPGLSDDERQQAQARIDVLRPTIAVVSVSSTPAGAEVFVDRLDLAPRGRTPLEIALPPGEHTLYFRHPQYEDAETRVVAETGATRQVGARLTPRPVEVRIEAPAGGELFLDGEPVAAGPRALRPGEHRARLELPGHVPTERRFTVQPGDGPTTIRLAPGPATHGTLRVHSSVPARVFVDGHPVGTGRDVELQLAPGTHRVRVAAEGHRPFELPVAVEAGRRSEVRAVLARPSRHLGVLPHVALGLTAAGTAVWGGLSVRALRMRREYDDACAQNPPQCGWSSFRDVERANLTADIALGVAGALAITTLVLYLLNRANGAHSHAHVKLSWGPNSGGHLRLGGRF